MAARNRAFRDPALCRWRAASLHPRRGPDRAWRHGLPRIAENQCARVNRLTPLDPGLHLENTLEKNPRFLGRLSSSFRIRRHTSLGGPSTLISDKPKAFAYIAKASRRGKSAAQEVTSVSSLLKAVTDTATDTPLPFASQKT